MNRISRNFLIKKLYSTLPHGAPFDVATLDTLGISAKQAAQYVENGWLLRLAQGIYTFPGDRLQLHDSIKFLQSRAAGLHVASKSALALRGVRHHLSLREPLVLWGDTRFELPKWFTSRFPARYSSSKLFIWNDTDLFKKTLTTPPGITENLLVSVSERAILELLSEVGTHESLEDARNLFDGLRNPRLDILGKLLVCCNSVKTVRLFLQWARETAVVNVSQLERKYSLPIGSERRWMKRLRDGTLLTLKPHG